MEIKELFAEIKADATQLEADYAKTTTFDGGRTIMPRKEFTGKVQSLINKVSSVNTLAVEVRKGKTSGSNPQL